MPGAEHRDEVVAARSSGRRACTACSARRPGSASCSTSRTARRAPGVVRFQRSFSPVGMMTSLIERLAEAGDLRPAAVELAVDGRRSGGRSTTRRRSCGSACRPARSGSAGRSCGRCSRTGSPCRRPCSRSCPALRIATRSKIAPTSAKNGSSRWPAKIETPPLWTIVFSADCLVVLDADEALLKRGPMLSIGVLPVANGLPFSVAVHVCCVLPRKYGPVGVLNRNVYGHVRLAVAVPVDVDVVLGGLRERVVVRPGRRILTGDPVGRRWSACSACPGCGTRRGRCCPPSGPPRSAAPRGGSTRCSTLGARRPTKSASRVTPAATRQTSANFRMVHLLLVFATTGLVVDCRLFAPRA